MLHSETLIEGAIQTHSVRPRGVCQRVKEPLSVSSVVCPWGSHSQSRFLLIKWMSSLIKFHLAVEHKPGCRHQAVPSPLKKEGTERDQRDCASLSTLPGFLYVSWLIKGERERNTERDCMLDKEKGQQKSPRDGTVYRRATVHVCERPAENPAPLVCVVPARLCRR